MRHIVNVARVLVDCLLVKVDISPALVICRHLRILVIIRCIAVHVWRWLWVHRNHFFYRTDALCKMAQYLLVTRTTTNQTITKINEQNLSYNYFSHWLKILFRNSKKCWERGDEVLNNRYKTDSCSLLNCFYNFEVIIQELFPIVVRIVLILNLKILF